MSGTSVVTGSSCIVTATFTANATSGAISIPGLKIGDIIVDGLVNGMAVWSGFETSFENVVSANDQLQQLNVNNLTGLTFVIYLVRPLANGPLPVFNSAGPVSGVKIWTGTATTDSSGNWSVDYSSAGFTNVPNVQPNAISAGTGTAQAASTTMTAPSKTGASGKCFIPNAISLLGVLPLQAAGAGITVQVMAIGT